MWHPSGGAPFDPVAGRPHRAGAPQRENGRCPARRWMAAWPAPSRRMDGLGDGWREWARWMEWPRPLGRLLTLLAWTSSRLGTGAGKRIKAVPAPCTHGAVLRGRRRTRRPAMQTTCKRWSRGGGRRRRSRPALGSTPRRANHESLFCLFLLFSCTQLSCRPPDSRAAAKHGQHPTQPGPTHTLTRAITPAHVNRGRPTHACTQSNQQKIGGYGTSYGTNYGTNAMVQLWYNRGNKVLYTPRRAAAAIGRAAPRAPAASRADQARACRGSARPPRGIRSAAAGRRRKYTPRPPRPPYARPPYGTTPPRHRGRDGTSRQGASEDRKGGHTGQPSGPPHPPPFRQPKTAQ